MVEKDHPHLSIAKQCRLLSISRSAFYYKPKGETALNLVNGGVITDHAAAQKCTTLAR